MDPIDEENASRNVWWCISTLLKRPTLYKGNFKKIQRKIMKSSILRFWAVKPIHKLLNGICLHSLGPNASFETHIAISRHDKCRMPSASFMSKCQKGHFWHINHPTNFIHRHGNMGVKRFVRTFGMKTNAIKQLVNGFNGTKYQNTNFWNFPLYFLKYPLYNVRS